MSGQPDPKSRILARPWKRTPRQRASRREWSAIAAAKGGRCRFNVADCRGRVELHHLVSRAQLGDDVADNIVPLCGFHHALVTRHAAPMLRGLAARLSDAEYAYVIGKLGEAGMERLFGVGRS